MAKLRIFMCALFGHRSIILHSKEVHVSGGKQYATVTKCERCGTINTVYGNSPKK